MQSAPNLFCRRSRSLRHSMERCRSGQRAVSTTATVLRGTEGSNPPPSASESPANLTFSIRGARAHDEWRQRAILSADGISGAVLEGADGRAPQRPAHRSLPLGDRFLACNRDFHRAAPHSCWHARDAALDDSVKLSAPACKSGAGRVFWLPSVHLEFDFDRCLDLHRDLQAGFGTTQHSMGASGPPATQPRQHRRRSSAARARTSSVAALLSGQDGGVRPIAKPSDAGEAQPVAAARATPQSP